MAQPSNAELMQQMMQMLQRQQELINTLAASQREGVLKVDGLRMPTYSGRNEESARLFYMQIHQYFSARGTNWKSESVAPQILAVLGSLLRGPAAQWFLLHQEEIHSVDEFFIAIENEFVPADLQHSLRDDLHRLKQTNCAGLVDNIAKFRQIISQVTEMTEFDQIIYFQRGLRQRTQEEVRYRCTTILPDAISVALDLERAHSGGYNNHAAAHPRPGPQYGVRESSQDPEPMEIDHARPFQRSSHLRINITAPTDV